MRPARSVRTVTSAGSLPRRREVVDGERAEVAIGIGDLRRERLDEHRGDVAAVRAALDPPPGVDPRRVGAVAGRDDRRVEVEARVDVAQRPSTGEARV